MSDSNVTTVKNKQKKLAKKSFFAGMMKLQATEEKSRIRIRNPVVRIRGSGSISYRYGSGTLGF